MSPNTLLLAVVSWLATYLIHSTALLGATALATTRIRSEVWRDTLWKLALVGGIITASIQVGFDLNPAGGRMSVAVPTNSVSASLSVSQADPDTRSLRSLLRDDIGSNPSTSEPLIARPDAGTGGSSVQNSTPQTTLVAPASSAGPLRTVAVIWAVIASLLLLRLAYRHVRLFRMLGDRRQVVEGGLAEMLAELRRNAGIWRPVWLAASANCPSPLALGASEICVPERFVTELHRDEQRAALAHELAHIARRDPAWHLVAGIIESVLFFQPLNRLARLRMRDAAEHLCDDWAVDHVGSEIGLARCLAAVASWIAPGRDPIPAGTMAMAEGGSPLLVRVQRLLERRPRGGVVPATTRVLAVAALMAVLVAAAPVIVTNDAAEARSSESMVPPRFVAPLVDTRAAETPTRVASDSFATTAPSNRAVAKVIPESVSVFRSPENGSVQQRWDWARAEARRRNDRTYWIAWCVPSVVPKGHVVAHDTRGFNLADLNEIPVATALRVEAQTDRVRGEASAAVIMFKLWMPPNDIMQIERISVRTATTGMRFGAPVFWLGAPPVGDSKRWLGGLLEGLGRGQLPNAIVAAVAIHRDTGVVAWLDEIITDDRAESLHTEAIEGLQWHPSDAVLGRLADLAREGATAEMQREAIESIGSMRHPKAGDILRKLRKEIGDAGVRRQVVESMGDQPDSAMLDALMEAANTDSDLRVRRQAAEAIGKLNPVHAVLGLTSLIWNSNSQGVQVEAVEALGDVGNRQAFDALSIVVSRHEDERVVIEAVETMGAFDGDRAARALMEVARTHPLASVRAKAMEETGDLDRRNRGQRKTVTPDNSEGNIDPGNFNPGNVDPGNFNSGIKDAMKGARKPAHQSYR